MTGSGYVRVFGGCRAQDFHGAPSCAGGKNDREDAEALRNPRRSSRGCFAALRGAALMSIGWVGGSVIAAGSIDCDLIGGPFLHSW